MPTIESDLLVANLDDQLREIIAAAPDMPLDDGDADQATVAALRNWLKSKPDMPLTCLAGLWLLAGDLDRSHTLSQAIDNQNGSYWHGIMHRREGDYFNAKYWMRRTSGHPVTDKLKSLSRDYRDATSFVDYVEQAVIKQTAWRANAVQIQWLEWQLLFSHCLNESISS